MCLGNALDAVNRSPGWLPLSSHCAWHSECISLHVLQTRELRIRESPSWGLSGKEPACQHRRCRLDPWVGKIPWRRKWQPTPVLLPGKSHGQRSLAGCSPWGCKRARHVLATKQQAKRGKGTTQHHPVGKW